MVVVLIRANLGCNLLVGLFLPILHFLLDLSRINVGMGIELAHLLLVSVSRWHEISHILSLRLILDNLFLSIFDDLGFVVSWLLSDTKLLEGSLNLLYLLLTIDDYLRFILDALFNYDSQDKQDVFDYYET